MTEKTILREIELLIRGEGGLGRPGMEIWAKVEPLFKRTLPRTFLAGRVHRLLKENDVKGAAALVEEENGSSVPQFLIPLSRKLIIYGRILLGIHLVGLALIGIGLYDLQQAGESADWKSAYGLIIESRVVVTQSRDSGGRLVTSRSEKIIYEFELDGKMYQGNKVRFGFTFLADLEKYPRGAEVLVYYDPRDPKNSILEKEINKMLYYIPGLGVFIFVGSFIYGIFRLMYVISTRYWKKRKKRREKEMRA